MSLAEDVGDGDHSSLASIGENVIQEAQLIVKDNGILAGVNLAERICLKVDDSLKFDLKIKDGSTVQVGDIAFTLSGKARSILKAERLVLNCMQRMSGIATYTHSLNKLIEGTGARLLDTRKTTPLFRAMEKWAVVIGGGMNHRFNLADMIMLKDNHIDYAGGMEQAISQTQAYLKANKKKLKIEVETRSLEEVSQVVKIGGVDRVMFDNMAPDLLKQAVKLVAGKMETEASGGITEKTIRAVAETGVDFISVGALTHSVKSLDMSLKAINN